MTTAATPLVCTGCGRPRATLDGVCPECSTPGGHGERRFVTVLFADLAGYTRLCAARDPEEVHALVRPLMNGLRQICQSLGGFVPSIEGDGFLAVFGARRTAEDDPLRALSAAARMQRWVHRAGTLAEELSGLHVAVHAGDVLVAPTWEPSGLALSGDPVNVSRRLCSEAGAGEVLVSDVVVALAAGVDAWGEARTFSLRGRDEAVHACTLDWGRIGELVPSRTWGSVTPYLSRPDVESALRAALGRGPVLLCGDAGTGKSRLVREVLAGRPYRVVSCAGARTARVRELAAAVLEQEPGVGDDLVALLRGESTTGEPPDEPALVAAAAAALEDAPDGDVLVLEDAEHVQDDDEIALLARLVSGPRRPWLVVSRRALPVAAATVEVPHLAAEESRAFLDRLMPRASAELAQQVLSRAGDLPLYLEQCVRLLLETGAVVVEQHETRLEAPELLRSVPTSMKLFVSSRLELLTPEERDVVDVAAVLGDVPDLDLLRHLTGASDEVLDRLVDRNLLRWGDGPLGLPELRFCHALVRDVAYDRLLRSRRQTVHRAAAEWYASLPAAQVLEAQAFHLEAAAALGDADCDLVARAVEALVLFARSVEEERTPVALDALTRARALVAGHPSCPVDTLQLDLCWSTVTCLVGRQAEAAEAARRAVDAAATRADRKSEAEARLAHARAVWNTEPDLAAAELAQAEQLFVEVGDDGGRGRVAVEHAVLRELEEGLGAFLASMEQAYQLAMRAGDRRLQVSAAQQLALHHAIATGRGPFEHWAQRARELSRPDDVGLEPRLDLSQAVLAWMGRRPADGLEAARRALQAARELGLSHVLVNAMITRFELLLLAGDLEGADALLPFCREVAATAPTERVARYLDLEEARLRVRQGDVRTSDRLLERVAQDDLAGSKGMVRDLAEARAWVLADRGSFQEARAQALQAVLLFEEMADRCGGLRPRLLALVAAVAQSQALPLSDIARLRSDARDAGLPSIAELASRWLFVDDLTRGWAVDLHGLTPMPDLVEARALDLEIEALTGRTWDRFLDAAAVWGELGTTVWQARALLWHSELTGAEHPEADRLLEVLQSPAGLGDQLRAQVRALKD